MALRTPALWMGNPAVQHTAQNDRLFRAGLLRPEPGSTAATRPLTATSGVIAGLPGTMGEVTLLSNTQFTVNPGRWVVYATASALGGSYEVTNDAVETLAITAQDASQYRKSYFGVWVTDSFVAGSGDDLPHRGLVDGTLAASAVAAALPSAGVLPANFLALGEFLIPPVGSAVTYTPYDLRTGLRGGILPVTTTDTRIPAFDGQYRDHPTYGLQRGSAGAWRAPSVGATWTAFPLLNNTGITSYQANPTAGAGAVGQSAPTMSYRIENGRVWLRGWAYSATGYSGTPLLTATPLPPEARPPYLATIWPINVNTRSPSRHEIETNGTMYFIDSVAIGAATYLDFDGISYALT